jgi:signal transduction histidine kinase
MCGEAWSQASQGLRPSGPVHDSRAWLFAFERFLRSRPVLVGAAAVAGTAAIFLAKQHTSGDASLALSYGIPVALCGYSLGVVAGFGMAVLGAGLWLMDAFQSRLSGGEAAYIFVVRLLTNFGIAGFAAVARNAVRERERSLAAQAELTRLRADLVAAFAHDMRTPLGSIIGYADTLRESLPADVSSDQTRGLDRITANAQRLDTLIGDMILAEQRLESVPLTVTAFEITGVVAELRAEFDQVGDTASPALMWHVGSGTPPFYSDRSKLTSVIRNLVANALKFTAQGSVQVNIAYDAATATHSVAVDDTGSGIAPEDVPLVFDRFFRGKNPNAGGFGLGLYIVKRFTELLGGTVSVHSEIGRGTRFIVTVPRLPLSGPETC